MNTFLLASFLLFVTVNCEPDADKFNLLSELIIGSQQKIEQFVLASEKSTKEMILASEKSTQDMILASEKRSEKSTKEMILASENSTKEMILASENSTKEMILASEKRSELRNNQSEIRITTALKSHIDFVNVIHDQNLMTSTVFQSETLRIVRNIGFSGRPSLFNGFILENTTNHVTATAVYIEYNGTNATGLMMPVHLVTEGHLPPSGFFECGDNLDVAFTFDCPSMTKGVLNLSNFASPVVGGSFACSGMMFANESFNLRTSFGIVRGKLGLNLFGKAWSGQVIVNSDNYVTSGMQEHGMSGGTCKNENLSYIGSVNSRLNGVNDFTSTGIIQDAASIVKCFIGIIKNNPLKAKSSSVCRIDVVNIV